MKIIAMMLWRLKNSNMVQIEDRNFVVVDLANEVVIDFFSVGRTEALWVSKRGKVSLDTLDKI